MKRFADFIFGIYSSGTPESSKRFFGSIGFVLAITIISVFKQDMIDEVLYVSAALLGLETLTGIVGQKKSKK